MGFVLIPDHCLSIYFTTVMLIHDFLSAITVVNPDEAK